MTSWTPPAVEVVSVERRGDTTFVGLRLCGGLTPPIAPASLVSAGETVLQLHAVVADADDITMFRTRDEPATDLVGRVVEFQQWWIPEAFDAVTDVSRRWTLEPAPPPEHHEHCLLDETTIEAGGEATVGYRNGEDWICPACYDHYIVDDFLGLRS